MKRIFLIYWCWYVVTLIILIAGISMPIELSKLIGVSMIFNFAFIGFAPLYNLIYSKRTYRSDQRFLNACLYSGVIRTVIWAFGFFGLHDHLYILAINCFGMLVFILIESKLKQIDKSYFNL